MSRFDRWSKEGILSGDEAKRTQANINSVMRDILGERLRPGFIDPAHPRGAPTVTVGAAQPVAKPFEPNVSDVMPDGTRWRPLEPPLPKLASSVCASAVAPKHARAEVVDRGGGEVSPVEPPPTIPRSVASSGNVVKRRKV